MLVNSGGKFQPLKIIPIVIPTRIYTAAGTVRLEHVYSIPRLSGAKQLQSARGKKLLAHILRLERGQLPENRQISKIVESWESIFMF